MAAGSRILVVLTSNARRGAEIEGSRVARELEARGLPASVAALSGPGDDSTGLPVEVLGRRPLGVGTLRGLRKAGRSFDLVVAFGSTTLPACAAALAGTGTPWIYRSIGDPAAWAGGAARRRRTGLQIRRAAAVVALWDGAAEWIRRHYGVGEVTSIPNARRASEFPPATAAERGRAKAERLGNTDPTVALVGALTEEKRPDLAVRIVAGLEHTNLVIAGDGPRRGEVEALASRLLPGRFLSLGNVTDVRPVYAMADALLLTSRTEGMPGVVIEALMAGVGVVASDVGAIASIHPAIRLVKPEAPLPTWRDAVHSAVSSRPDSTSMDRFDWSAVGDAWFRTLTAHLWPSARG